MICNIWSCYHIVNQFVLLFCFYQSVFIYYFIEVAISFCVEGSRKVQCAVLWLDSVSVKLYRYNSFEKSVLYKWLINKCPATQLKTLFTIHICVSTRLMHYDDTLLIDWKYTCVMECKHCPREDKNSSRFFGGEKGCTRSV